jgi:hypothetical protein
MELQDLRRLKPELESFLDRFAPLFGRPEAQGHGRRFVQGLLLGRPPERREHRRGHRRVRRPVTPDVRHQRPLEW